MTLMPVDQNAATIVATERVKVRQAKRLEEARRRLAASPHHRAVREIVASPAGKVLMDWLMKEFLFGDLMGETPEETAFNLGEREVVRILLEIRDFGERTGSDG